MEIRVDFLYNNFLYLYFVARLLIIFVLSIIMNQLYYDQYSIMTASLAMAEQTNLAMTTIYDTEVIRG